MGLHLCNAYPRRITTSIMFLSPRSCGGDGGDFEMMGWWNIDPGSCAFVYANDVDVNQFWYCFAQATDGAVWAGPWGVSVPKEPFGGDRWCWGIRRSHDEGEILSIGYRQFDIGDAEDFTLTFVP